MVNDTVALLNKDASKMILAQDDAWKRFLELPNSPEKDEILEGLELTEMGLREIRDGCGKFFK